MSYAADEVLAELVGGPCDGLQLEPGDGGEPHDWPFEVGMTITSTGLAAEYRLREGKPAERPGQLVYFYDWIPERTQRIA